MPIAMILLFLTANVTLKVRPLLVAPLRNIALARFTYRCMRSSTADMTSAIETNVPEVTAVHDISFQRLPNRQLHVTFSVEADIDGNTEEVEGGTDIGD